MEILRCVGVVSKLLAAIAVIVVVAIAVYALIPVTVATSPHQMKDHHEYYAYGRVSSDLSVNGHSLFLLNDSGSMVAVEYNGTSPALNSTVLVHGEYLNFTFFGYSYGGVMEADEVFNWYLAA